MRQGTKGADFVCLKEFNRTGLLPRFTHLHYRLKKTLAIYEQINSVVSGTPRELPLDIQGPRLGKRYEKHPAKLRQVDIHHTLMHMCPPTHPHGVESMSAMHSWLRPHLTLTGASLLKRQGSWSISLVSLALSSSRISKRNFFSIN